MSSASDGEARLKGSGRGSPAPLRYFSLAYQCATTWGRSVMPARLSKSHRCDLGFSAEQIDSNCCESSAGEMPLCTRMRAKRSSASRANARVLGLFWRGGATQGEFGGRI